MTYTEATLNGVVLNITSIRPSQPQKTKKQVIGRTLVESRIIGLNDVQHVLQINGIVLGTTSSNLDTNRSNIEALDNATAYTYSDGVNNGTYYIKSGSLQFDDTNDKVNTHYTYSCTLVEE